MLIINLTSQVLDTKPLKYGLHQSFTDKNKSVMRNVTLEIEALATSLNHYAEQSSKKAFREYLSPCTSVITKITYINKDDTFALLQKPRKNKDIIIPSADKES